MTFETGLFLEFLTALSAVSIGSYLVYIIPILRNRRDYAKVFRKFLRHKWHSPLSMVVDNLENYDFNGDEPIQSGHSQKVGYIHEREIFWDEHKKDFLHFFDADFYLNVYELFLRFKEMDKIDTQEKKDRIKLIERKMDELLYYLKNIDETCLFFQIFGFPKKEFDFINEYISKEL